jgi:hypothetical protein
MDDEKWLIDLVDKVIDEHKQKEIKRKQIIENGCPHTNKIKCIATISKIEFLECDICFKQFDLDGNEIK